MKSTHRKLLWVGAMIVCLAILATAAVCWRNVNDNAQVLGVRTITPGRRLAEMIQLRVAGSNLASESVQLANDQGGAYPESLDQLLKARKIPASYLDPLNASHGVGAPAMAEALPESQRQFVYVGAGLRLGHAEGIVVLFSKPSAAPGARLIVFADAGGDVWVSEETFQQIESKVKAHAPLDRSTLPQLEKS